MFSLICLWTKDWVNTREADDLRHHCAHYDVNLMTHLISMHFTVGSTYVLIAQEKCNEYNFRTTSSYKQIYHSLNPNIISQTIISRDVLLLPCINFFLEGIEHLQQPGNVKGSLKNVNLLPEFRRDCTPEANTLRCVVIHKLFTIKYTYSLLYFILMELLCQWWPNWLHLSITLGLFLLLSATEPISPKQNYLHFAEGILKRIFIHEKFCILI